MPASKTLPLERRIAKLEQEVAAYKRELGKRQPGENAAARAELGRELRSTLVALQSAVSEFLATAEQHGLRWWVFHPDVAVTAQKLADLAKAAELAFPPSAPQPPAKRTPQ